MLRPVKTTIALLTILALAAPLEATAKRKKKPDEEEAPPQPEPATFQVYGSFVQDQFDYEYGKRMECDLYLYLVDGGQPVTDATVTVGETVLEPDSWLPGRYRKIQACVEPGTPLPVHIQRANQFWDCNTAMLGFPVIVEPAFGTEVPATSDLTIRWEPAEGATSYRLDVEGMDKHWVTSEPWIVLPKEEVPPYQHHEITLTAYGAGANPDATTTPLNGAEPTWPGLNPVTRTRTELDFGPGLMGQNWAGQQVIRWWLEDGKTYDEDLYKVWLLLNKDGSYVLRRIKIAFFEQGMLDGREIPWEFYDTGTFRLAEAGVLALESGESDLQWTASYKEPALSLLKILPPTEDPIILKQRRYDGSPKAWELQIEDVEPVTF